MSAEKDVKLSVYDDKEDSVNSSLLERTTGPAKDSLPTSIPDKAASLTSADGVKKIWPGTYNAPRARCKCPPAVLFPSFHRTASPGTFRRGV
jgi:hypothetical protein